MYGNFYNPYLMNPMLSQQNRLANMESQFYGQNNIPYNGMNNTQQSQQNNFILKGRPVSNFEEANASMIDLDGSVFIFPDYAHKKVYTKQIGIDGSPIINSYSLDNPNAINNSNNIQTNNTSISAENNSQFVDKINFLEQRVSELESQVKYYVQSSTSNDAIKTNAKSYASNDTDVPE